MKLEFEGDGIYWVSALVIIGVTVLMAMWISGCGDLGLNSKRSYECMDGGEHCHDHPTINDRSGDGEDPLIGPQGPRGEIGPQGPVGQTGIGTPGTGCSLRDTVGGIILTCGDTTTILHHGAIGSTGAPGSTGPAGSTGETGATGAPGEAGAPGTNGVNGSNGTDGIAGADGAPGAAGANGQDGFSVVASTEVILSGDYFCPTGGTRIRLARDLDRDGLWSLSDDQQQIASICNGAVGATGAAGTNGTNAPPTPFSPVGLVDPCGDAPGIYDEVFLKLANGTLLASFSDNSAGQNTRFSVLSTGSYVTTDSSHCYFSVDASNNVYNEHY